MLTIGRINNVKPIYRRINVSQRGGAEKQGMQTKSYESLSPVLASRPYLSSQPSLCSLSFHLRGHPKGSDQSGLDFSFSEQNIGKKKFFLPPGFIKSSSSALSSRGSGGAEGWLILADLQSKS